MELSSDEFVILKDDMCHIVTGAGQQIKILPSTLYLTNKKVFVASQYEKLNKYCMELNAINTCLKAEMNDCNVLKIIGRNPLNTLSIFIPNIEHQETFAEILQKLLVTMDAGQTQFDALALGLQRRVRESGDINKFYDEYNSIKDNLIKEPPTQAAIKESEQSIKLLTHFQETPFKFIDIVDDMINRDEILFFTVFASFILISNFIFLFIPFGFFLSFSLFLILLKGGVSIIFAKDSSKLRKKKQETSQKWRIRFRKIIGSFEKFRVAFERRLLWKNPRQTLDVVMFLLSVALLFRFFDPAFVLATSMFGLGFVERWNPFGFGSLSEIITNLFTFSK
jgi:hypothetical protein